MDYSRNAKYFTHSDAHFYVGLPIFAVGAIFVVLGYLFWIYLFDSQEVVGLLMIALGGAIAFIPRWKRATESDLDEIVAALQTDIADDTAAHFGFATGASASTSATVIGGYDLDCANILLRKGKDSKFRSSVYTLGAVILSAKGRLYFSKKSVCLTEENGLTEYNEIALATVEKTEVRTEEKLLAGVHTKTYRFVITAEGREVLSLPTGSSSAILDSLCENILREADRAKSE